MLIVKHFEMQKPFDDLGERTPVPFYKVHPISRDGWEGRNISGIGLGFGNQDLFGSSLDAHQPYLFIY